MAKKIAGKFDALVALGLAFFLAWRQNVINFLYPISAGLVVSPLVCCSFSCCLVLVLALVALRRNQATFSSTYVVMAPSVLIAAASVLSYLVAKDIGGMPVAYVCCVIAGVASAFGLFAWVEMLAVVDMGKRIATVSLSLFLKPLISIAAISMGAYAGPLPISLLALVVIAILAVHGMRSAHREIKPLIMRPTSSSHFRLLLGALVVYAFIFGVTAGNTAAVAEVDYMLEFSRGVDYCMLGLGALLLVLSVTLGKQVRLVSFGRILTPVLAVLFLMHIAIGGSADGLLPKLTTAFWDVVQVFVLLVLIDLSQSGIASLSFVFPIGWAVVSLGHAFGTLVGQATGIAFGNDFAMVQTITVAMTILAVVASSVLAAAQYPTPAADMNLPFVPVDVPKGAEEWADSPERVGAGMAVAGGSAAARAGRAGSVSDAAGSRPAPAEPSRDPIVQACEVISKKYALSERESEVLDLLARGNTRMSIAEKLVISENTVRVHVKNIYAKLHIHSKQQLIDMVDKRA